MFTSGDAHSIHSPFVFELYTKVISNSKYYYVFKEIESLRRKLLKKNHQIIVTDLGAGSVIDSSPVRKISQIAMYSEKSPKLAQLLFKLALYFKPASIIELGTSLGITTTYLSKSNSGIPVYTFEGCPNVSDIAKKNFVKLNCNNIILVDGNIDDTLEPFIKNFAATDFVFFDANHRYLSTIRYFNLCLTKANQNSVFIFDDVHWSEEMEKAWKEIGQHPKVTLTIDLFFMGLVFFKQTLPKQHFKLRF